MPCPAICLVTDRRRLRPESGWSADPAAALLAQIAAAAAAGVDYVQLRERDLPANALLGLAARAVRVAAGARTRILVNDRLDVALAAGAAGVHLQEQSVPAGRVRTLAPAGFVISRAVHDPAGAAAQGADPDVLVFGTVFSSASKPSETPAGPDGLRRAVRAARVPVLAIGGVTVERLPDIAATGAAGIAAIGLFADLAGPGAAGLADIVDRIRKTWRVL